MMMQTTTKTTVEARRSFFSKTLPEETLKSNAQNHEHSFGGDVETHHRDDDALYDDEHNRWENNEDFDEDYHDYDRYQAPIIKQLKKNTQNVHTKTSASRTSSES